MTYGYAVLIEYWNGNTYQLDYDAITVYSTREEAEIVAKDLTQHYGADGMISVAEVEIK